jgi:hypothetical protein
MRFVARHKVAVIVLALIAAFCLLGLGVFLVGPNN